MKKFFMSMAAMVVAISASAQVYVGGGMGLASQKVGDGDSKLSYINLSACADCYNHSSH